MRFKSYHDGAIDLKTGIWVAFWLYVLQAGSPDLLTTIIQWIGRQ